MAITDFAPPSGFFSSATSAHMWAATSATSFAGITDGYWGVPDLTGPTIDSNTPTGVAERNTHITFDVTDASGVDLTSVIVYVDTGSGEVGAYSSSAFNYLLGFYGFVSTISDGYAFDLYLSTHWPQGGSVAVRVVAADDLGNESELEWSFLVSSASEKPHILCTNVDITNSKWNKDTGILSETNRADTVMTTARLWDGYTHIVSKLADAHIGVSTVYITIQVDGNWDSWALINHNLGTCATGGTVLTLHASDDSAFGTYEIFPEVTLSSGGLRVVQCYGAVYSYNYIRLKIQTASGNFDYAPYVGEFLIGESHKLYAHFDVGVDYKALEGQWDEHRADDGTLYRVQRYAGASDTRLSLTFPDTTEAQVMRDAYADCDYGVKPVLVIPYPLSAPRESIYGYLPERLTVPHIGSNMCRVETEFREVRPFYSEET